VKRGGDRTRVANVVPELDDEASRSEGGTFEEPVVPFLKSVSVNNS